MSRRSSPGPGGGGGGNTKEKRDPRENDALFLSFVGRSIDRCDVELSALMELNRSLHKAKQNVIDRCGTETLIHMAQGLLRYSSHGTASATTTTMTATKKAGDGTVDQGPLTTVATATATATAAPVVEGTTTTHINGTKTTTTTNAQGGTTVTTTTTTLNGPPSVGGDVKQHDTDNVTTATATTSPVAATTSPDGTTTTDTDAVSPTMVTPTAATTNPTDDDHRHGSSLPFGPGSECLEADDPVYIPQNPNDYEVCLDFLSRMKLRKKILNRLCRRIHRLNCTLVDGQDVTPPPPPKYGDLRLHVDPKLVQDCALHWKCQDQAKQTIKKARTAFEEAKRKQQKEQQQLLEQQQKEKEKREAAAKAKKKKEEEQKTKEESDTDDMDVDKHEKEMQDGQKSKENNTMKQEEEEEEKKESSATENRDTTTNGDAAASAETHDLTTTRKALYIPSSPIKKQSSTPNDKDNKEEDDNNILMEVPPSYSPQQPLLEEEFDILREYDENYHKIINLETKQVKYSILEEEEEEAESEEHNKYIPDYESIKYGAGIGASHRSMTTKEKEAEWTRWKHSILGRIPDQPTFEELGTQYRVFKLEERLEALKKLKEKQQKDAAAAKSQEEKDTILSTPTKKKKSKQEDDDDDDDDVRDDDTPKKSNKTPDAKLSDDEKVDIEDMEISTEDNDDEDEDDEDFTPDEKDESKSPLKSPSKKRKRGDNDDDKDNKEKDSDDDDDDKKEGGDKKKDDDTKEKGDEEDKTKKKEGNWEDQFKKRKQMSVQAVPSFYEQDRRRILMIHADLMANNMHEHARERIARATNEYNACFRRSNEVYNRRVQVQTSLNNVLYETRIKSSKIKDNYALEVAIAKAQWTKRREAYEQQKLQTLFPSYRGQVAVGTSVTNAAMTNPNPTVATVASSIANIVDAVILLTESPIQLKKFEPFVPPPPSNPMNQIVNHKTGETFGQQQQRLETSLRMEMNNLAGRLATAEEDRKRAWKKMLKTRSEFEPEQYNGRKKYSNDSWQNVPCPNLRGSGAASIPTRYAYKAPSIPTYTPPASTHHHLNGQHVSDSKYSVARVKERIAADGTVAPVTQPKRNKDGTFQRPAGRTRKGMEWDAVRGIWVPEELYKQQQQRAQQHQKQQQR